MLLKIIALCYNYKPCFSFILYINLEPTKHCQHKVYQRVAEIDSWIADGMSWAERCEREADFALRASRMALDDKSRVLDLACGSGGHARRIASVTGARVDKNCTGRRS